MKFWDDKVDNGIDAMFDWDHDGELDRTEKMNELEWMTSSDDDELGDEDFNDEDEFDEDGDFDSDDFDDDF